MATTIESILADKGDDVRTIRADADLTRAASLMKTSEIAALVVVENDHVAGLIGERDIVAAVADGRGSVTGVKVGDVMQRRPETCSSNDLVHRVMETMTRKRRRHVPVVDDGRLAGIVSIGDMVKFRLNQMELETQVLRDAYRATH